MTHTRATRRTGRRLRRAALAVVVVLAALQVAGWLTAAPQVGHFRSREAHATYRAAYDDALGRMPTPDRVVEVVTSFGTVRTYAWIGPDAGAPVVLLPGRGSGVPMWSENLPHLLGGRTVYALDALGDAGLSAQTVPLRAMADQAQWLDETLAGLGIARAHVVGHSFGAASAAALARDHPERIATLSLLEPAFVLGWPPIGVLGWSVVASVPFLPQAWRDAAIARIAGEDPSLVAADDPVARMIALGGTGYSAELPTPQPLSDDELRGLGVPTYVALAGDSPITGGERSSARAALIPGAQVRVWPDTTHSLPMQVPERLAAELAAFWAAHDA